MKPYCVDVDDFCDATVAELQMLTELKDQLPELKVTLFTIPQRTSDATIKKAKGLGDWLQLAPHGWRHTKGECLSWTDDEAREKITLARDRGIDAPLFRAPAWLLDADVYTACKDLNYAVASHKTFRIPNTGVREYVYNMRWPGMKKFRSIHGHVTPVMGNYIRDMMTKGMFDLPAESTFVFPQEVATCVC